MHSRHFGLLQDPFSIAPDPRYLFMSERHREALAHLLFGVAGSGGNAGGAGGGFVLLTGDIGTGKTTICRCFLEQIPSNCHVAYIFNPKLTVTELLQSICEEFRVSVAGTVSTAPSVKDYIDALNVFLLESHAAGQSNILIIDEAQNLEPEVLEQLRLLTNLETSERKLLQIVLIGQPELRSKLSRPELEQLAQRVIARFHLDALTEAETIQYVAHRLAVAGLTGPAPFDRRALQHVHRLARGVPRRINLLCGRALLGAWANGLHRVDRKVLDKAADEVFGTEKRRIRFADRRRVGYVSGFVLLVAGSSVAAYLFWPHDPPKLSAVPLGAGPPSIASPTRNASAPETATAVSPAVASALAEARPSVSVAAGPAATPPVAAAPAQPAVPVVLEDVDTLLPKLPGDMRVAWRELAPLWDLQVTEGEPCAVAAARQVQCYRATHLTLPSLRQLGRPGILTLRGEHGEPVYALLVGLNDQAATLKTADGLHPIRLVSLGRVWRGDFATYWRPPSGYVPDLREGATGPAIEYLAQRLDLLDGKTEHATGSAPSVLDGALRARVRAFQRAQGLMPDGQPGPMTFMQLDSAIATNQPRLAEGPR